MQNYRIGIIGGSGLYHIEGFTEQKWTKVRTPFGSPSDELLLGKIENVRWCFCHATDAAIAFSRVN